MTAEETRVVLIKPGDALVIGGVRDAPLDALERAVDGLREIGLPGLILTTDDASIAVAEHDADRDRFQAQYDELRDAVSKKLGFGVAMPHFALIEELSKPGGDA